MRQQRSHSSADPTDCPTDTFTCWCLQVGADKTSEMLGRVAGQDAQRSVNQLLQVLRENYSAIRGQLDPQVQQQLDSAYSSIFGDVPQTALPSSSSPAPALIGPERGLRQADGPAAGPVGPAADPAGASDADDICPDGCLDLTSFRFLPEEMRCICVEQGIGEVGREAGEVVKHLLPVLAGAAAMSCAASWLLMYSVAW